MKKLLLLTLLTIGMAGLQGLNAQELKVISFNIHNNSSPKTDGPNAWYLRQNAVLKMLDDEQPDIIGVQEALLDQLTVIDKNFKNKYRRVGAGRDNGITRGEHTAIYFDKNKFQLVSSKTRWLCPSPQRVMTGWDAKTPRTVTILQLKVKETGKEIFYFNTHLERDGSVAHAESVKVIANLIAQYVPKGTPVIVGGDMNSEIINNDFQPLYDAGFTPARRLASRTDFRNSYNAFGYEPGAMNDHFLVRDINVQRFRTINKDYGVPYISNHYPVRMIIKL